MIPSRPSRPPRLLVGTDTWPPQVNGVSVVTALSVSGLRERGWEVAVVAPRYPAPRTHAFPAESPPGANAGTTAIPSAPMPGYPDIRLALPSDRPIASLLREFRPDIVHSPTEFVLGRIAQRLARAAGIPAVSSYHTDFSRYTEAYGVGWLRPSVSRYLAEFHRRSRRVYTPSHVARGDLAAIGVNDVEVWGRGVDTHHFSPHRRSEALRAAYGSRDTFVLLHVGRMAAEKGVDRIIAAFDLARQSLPAGALHLVIAGSGPREDALRESVREGVTFLGNLDRGDVLPRLYASADAFLFASLTETLGLVVLEAMASGLPVIAVPAGGVADHLRDGVNGVACAANDVGDMAAAIVRLALDRPRTRRLAAGARETAEALDWSLELDALDRSYREVAFGGDRPVPLGIEIHASA
jgi:glycosyltransferase involved in cell wall biosynthesis